MNVTFLLGNGFDNAIDLQTSYEDFYSWYLEKENKIEEEKKLKDAIRSGGKIWEDFEYALGQFTSEFADKNKFINCFITARASLIEYLNDVYIRKKDLEPDFLNSTAYCLVDLSQQFFKDLNKKDRERYESMVDIEDLNIYYISYNYTPVHSDCCDQITSFAKYYWTQRHCHCRTECNIVDYINVHGLIGQDPIFGVNDISQIANEEFRQDKEIVNLMVKEEADKIAAKNWRANAVKFIKNSNVVCIFGMSLGDTDLFWWQQIAAWLESDINNELIIYDIIGSEDEKEDKERALRGKISSHFENVGFEDKIIVDLVKKRMKVGFKWLSTSGAIIEIMSKAKLSVVSPEELKELLERGTKE